MSNDLDNLMKDSMAISDPAKVDVLVPPKNPTRITKKKATEALIHKAAATANLTTKRKRASLENNSKMIVNAFKNFEEAVGGRDELAEVLKHCPSDSPAYKGIQLLFKDVNFTKLKDTALEAVCARHNVNLATLLTAFKDAKVAQLTLQTISKLAQHVPAVAEHVAGDAKNEFVFCPVCEGEQRVPRIGDDGEFAIDMDGNILTQLCYNCRGTGKIFQKHDPQSRKLFFQLTGLLKDGKDKDVTVQVANIMKGDFIPGDGTFEKLMRSIDIATTPVLEAPKEIPYAYYEAEVVETSKEPITNSDPAKSSEGN